MEEHGLSFPSEHAEECESVFSAAHLLLGSAAAAQKVLCGADNETLVRTAAALKRRNLAIPPPLMKHLRQAMDAKS